MIKAEAREFELKMRQIEMEIAVEAREMTALEAESRQTAGTN